MGNLERAIEIAVEKHKFQKDKAGMPYILHPLHVMCKMETEEEMIVAVFHDIIEDTDCTYEYLKNEGFSDEIIEAVKSLTHVDEEDYFEYIDRVKTNKISIKVKIADLEHNMDLKRLNNLTDEDLVRVTKKYRRAWDELKSHLRKC